MTEATVRWSEGRSIIVVMVTLLKMFTMTTYVSDAVDTALRGKPDNSNPMQSAPAQLAFATYLLVELLASAQLIFCTASQRWTASQLVDRFVLLMATNTPLMNLLYFHINPAGAAKKNTFAGSCMLLTLGAASGGSATHACFQWMCSAPTLVYIEYARRAACAAHAECTHSLAPCCSTNHFAAWLATTGAKAAAPLLCAFATLTLLGEQQHSPVSSHWQPPPVTPMSTLGIGFLEALGKHSCMARVEALVSGAKSSARAWGSSMLLWLPISMYYLVYALCSRSGMCLLSDVTAEEWVGTMLACIMLGRCSNRHDEDCLAEQIRCQLQRSLCLLTDLLPSHIVDHLLEELTATPQEPPPELHPASEEGASPHEEEGSCLIHAAPSCAAPMTLRLPETHSGSPFSHSSFLGTFSVQPPHVFTHATNTLSQHHDCCTVIFADLCGFSTWAHHSTPETVMETLNDLFSRLDSIIINEMPTLDKVDTVGDAYVVCCNLLTPDPDHAATAVRFALRAQQEVANVPRPDTDDGSPLQMRIGLHSGPLTSGILGRLRRRFSIYGDTVNMGSRTETSCPPGGIQVTASTYELAARQLEGHAVFVERGEVEVKGSDQPLKMYTVAQAAAATDRQSSCSGNLDQQPPQWAEQGGGGGLLKLGPS